MNFALLAKDLVEDKPDNQVIHYIKVLEEEYNFSQLEVRKSMKQNVLDELNRIRQSLNQLVEANNYADELEKLHSFFISILIL